MDNYEMPNNFFYNLPDPTLFAPNYGGASDGIDISSYTPDNTTPVNPIEEALLYKRIFEFAKMVGERKAKRAADIPRTTVRKWTIKEKGKLA